jgi:hypothetical protein
MLGHNKRLERKLKEQGGKQAWATVLESETQRTTTVHQVFNDLHGWHVPEAEPTMGVPRHV